MNINDLKNIKFDTDNKRGYNIEQVDKFVKDITKLLERSYQEIQDYKKDEDSIKNVLINAQKMADETIKESNDKAQSIIKEAEKEAELIVSEVHKKKEENFLRLKKIKSEANDFKVLLLKLYKSHIESISLIPDDSDEDVDIDSYDREHSLEKISDLDNKPASNKKNIDISFGEEDNTFDFDNLSSEEDSVIFDFTKLDFEE